ncbi:hypothetical protein ACSBR2_015493 [Camellia fascicularis]
MVHQFGNSLIQKFFRVCNSDQITQILFLVISKESYFMTICCDTHGTHAMQKLQEYLTTQEQKYRLMFVLGWFTVHLTNHMNGNHIIQYCLKIFSDEDNMHILREPVNRLVAKIAANALVLSKSRYGNHVMQFIQAMKEPYVQHAKADIFAQLAGNYVSLSFNKYRSNVVEKCLKQTGEDQAAQIIKEIINSPNFLMLVQDPYEKYIAQSAVMVSKGCVCQIILTLIEVEAEGMREWSRALRGIVFLVAKDKHDCLYLQKKIEEANSKETEMLFFKLKDHVRELMVFGVCKSDQITHILLLVISDERYFTTICCDTHGTHAMQKLLEYLNTQEQKYRLMSVLGWFTVHLTNYMSGNHVIQYCSKIFSDEDNRHILHELADNCLDIAIEKSGCCEEPINRLVVEIATTALLLSESRYGNYIMQFILAMKEPYVQHAKADIFAQLAGKYVSLSFNKYNSNVVERCLKKAGEDHAVQIIKEIINSPIFLMLVQDP